VRSCLASITFVHRVASNTNATTVSYRNRTRIPVQPLTWAALIRATKQQSSQPCARISWASTVTSAASSATCYQVTTRCVRAHGVMPSFCESTGVARESPERSLLSAKTRRHAANLPRTAVEPRERLCCSQSLKSTVNQRYAEQPVHSFVRATPGRSSCRAENA
jgi:hypothetical protein